MSGIIFDLSPQESLDHFRDLAQTVLEVTEQLSEWTLAKLREKAEEYEVHSLDCEHILWQIVCDNGLISDLEGNSQGFFCPNCKSRIQDLKLLCPVCEKTFIFVFEVTGCNKRRVIPQLIDDNGECSRRLSDRSQLNYHASKALIDDQPYTVAEIRDLANRKGEFKGKLRVYELAKYLGLENKELLAKLADAGVKVMSHASSLSDEDLQKFKVVRITSEEKYEEARKKPGIIRRRRKVVRQSVEEMLEEEKTYGQEGQTEPYSDSQRSGPIDFGTYHNFAPGNQIELSEGTYHIENILSSGRNAGEASVYQVKGPDQRSYALKLYYKFENPNYEPNAEALGRIAEIADPNILKLHAFGTGAKKYQHQNCYEISDLALGGTLLDVPDLKKKYTSEFIRSNVIPEIHKGLLCLHKQGIYHCDIKPENIFYLDADQTDLVIGDYGSAKTPESEVSHTSMVKGTNIYIAPEQRYWLISEKNDYYSFGMTLIRLLYPEKMAKESQSQMLVRLVNRKKILNFKPELSEFDDLICGLTLYDHDARWGAKEIDLWLAGETSSIIYGHDIPVKLGHGQEIHSDLDLIRILDEEEGWYTLLFAEQSSIDVLVRWVSVFYDLQTAKNFFALILRYKSKGTRDVLRKAARQFISRQRNQKN